MGENLGLGVSIYLYFLSAVILILGILSLIFIPKFAGEIKTGVGFSLDEFTKAFRDPVVWIAAISLFFVYFYYTGVTYTTPYMTGVLGVSLAAADDRRQHPQLRHHAAVGPGLRLDRQQVPSVHRDRDRVGWCSSAPCW